MVQLATGTTSWNINAFAPTSVLTGNGAFSFQDGGTRFSIIGLTPLGSQSIGYTSIAYGLQIGGLSGSNYIIYVVETGGACPYTSPAGFYSSSDVLSIKRVGSTVVYQKNGVTFYTSATTSTGSLIPDICFGWTGDQVTNCVIQK